MQDVESFQGRTWWFSTMPRRFLIETTWNINDKNNNANLINHWIIESAMYLISSSKTWKQIWRGWWLGSRWLLHNNRKKNQNSKQRKRNSNPHLYCGARTKFSVCPHKNKSPDISYSALFFLILVFPRFFSLPLSFPSFFFYFDNSARSIHERRMNRGTLSLSGFAIPYFFKLFFFFFLHLLWAARRQGEKWQSENGIVRSY